MPQFGPIRQTRGAALAVALAASLLAPSGEAAAAGADRTQEASHFVQSFVTKADLLLSNGSGQSADEGDQFRRLVQKGFDIETISQFVLADHWLAASQEERAEFRYLFESFLFSTYQKRLGALTGGRFEIVAARPDGDRGAEVRSRMRGNGGAPVFHVDWRLWRSGQAWRIVDVMVQGVSLVKTYRSQFTALIGADGGSLGRVLAALRAKVVADAR